MSLKVLTKLIIIYLTLLDFSVVTSAYYKLTDGHKLSLVSCSKGVVFI